MKVRVDWSTKRKEKCHNWFELQNIDIAEV